MGQIKKVGFVGFGSMAKLMAKRLVNADFDIVAFDPQYHQQELDGVKLFPDAASLAREVDAVIVSVPADAALEQASEGPGGILEGARNGLLLLNTSTVSLEASKKLAEASVKRGVRFVETPVSGSTPQAQNGTLVILAGGNVADLSLAEPILNAIGQKTVHVGAIGQGLVLKYIVNGIMALSVAALAEGIAYGVASGLDRDALIDTLKDLTLISEHDRPKLDMAKARSYEAQFSTKLLVKDIGLLLSHAGKQSVPLAGMAAVSQIYALATAKHADDDYSAVMETMEELASK